MPIIIIYKKRTLLTEGRCGNVWRSHRIFSIASARATSDGPVRGMSARKLPGSCAREGAGVDRRKRHRSPGHLLPASLCLPNPTIEFGPLLVGEWSLLCAAGVSFIYYDIVSYVLGMNGLACIFHVYRGEISGASCSSLAA